MKRRPVVASGIGGIQDQIRDGIDGVLLRDPRDLGEFAEAVQRLLSDDAFSSRIGRAGYERVRDNYLALSALERWGELLQQQIVDAEPKRVTIQPHSTL